MIAQSNTPFAFNYTAYDMATGLFVRAAVYDLTTGTPVFVQNVVMAEAALGSYNGLFTGLPGRVYAIISAVYTDGTYAVLDTNRAPATETVQSLSIIPTGGNPTANLITPDVLRGSLVDPPVLVGQFLC